MPFKHILQRRALWCNFPINIFFRGRKILLFMFVSICEKIQYNWVDLSKPYGRDLRHSIKCKVRCTGCCEVGPMRPCKSGKVFYKKCEKCCKIFKNRYVIYILNHLNSVDSEIVIFVTWKMEHVRIWKFATSVVSFTNQLMVKRCTRVGWGSARNATLTIYTHGVASSKKWSQKKIHQTTELYVLILTYHSKCFS